MDEPVTAETVRALVSACSNRFGLLADQPDGARFIEPVVAAVMNPRPVLWGAAKRVYIVWDVFERLSFGQVVERFSSWSPEVSPVPTQEQMVEALRAVHR